MPRGESALHAFVRAAYWQRPTSRPVITCPTQVTPDALHSLVVTHSCFWLAVHEAAQLVDMKKVLPVDDMPRLPQQICPLPQSAAWPHSKVFAIESIARHAFAVGTHESLKPPSPFESQQTLFALDVEHKSEP